MSREPLRVLILEHTPADAELSVLELERAGFAVEADIVGTATEYLDRLRQPVCDVVLADYRLPDWTGMEALVALKGLHRDIPFILVTGTLGEERAVECVKQGAADYILKQNLARLPSAVRRALAERHVRQRHARAEDLIRKLTLAVDQSPASVIITDTAGSIEYVNQRFTEVTGYTPEEALGQNPRLIQSGRTPPEVYRDMWGSLRDGRVWHGEVLNRAKSGALTWYAVTIAPLRSASGAVTHFVGTQEDISERMRSEQELREREQRFRQLAENITEVFFVADAAFGQTLYINPAYETIWGRSCQSLYDDPRSFMLPVPAEDRARLLASIERTRKGEDAGEVEFRVVRPDGQVRWVVAHAVPIRNDRGEVYRVCGVALDTTEKRTLEEQVRQGQRMEAVGSLAGGVAHDFNNLLTVISSYTHLLLEDLVPDDPRRDDVVQIALAATAAATLTQQLLAFSRRQVIEPRLLTIEQVVTNADKMLRRLIGEDIELVTVLSTEPATVRIDPGQLEQVVVNLVVNARDAMPTGGRLTIETTEVELDEAYARLHWPARPGRFVMIAVSDTGVGMDQATQARIFEPFFTTKEVGKGTGLGLSTAYGIVKQSGGFIWVYSEPGRGTTFKIYLPRLDARAGRLEQVPPPQQLRGSETVLLVEDAPGLRAAVRQILGRAGYTVLEVPGARAAIALAADRDQPIHLLLTDVVMPEMSGRELSERLVEMRPGLKVLYMSGYTDDAVVRHGVLAPGIAFLQKPFSPETLGRKIREVLDSPPGKGETS